MIEDTRGSMPKQQFGTVSGTIEINGKEALRNIYSPTHEVDVKRKGETGASISFETKNNDTDFQLFYGLSNGDFGMSLVTYREPGKDGYFLLMLSPKDNVSERELVNKDVVFVLDTRENKIVDVVCVVFQLANKLPATVGALDLPIAK